MHDLSRLIINVGFTTSFCTSVVVFPTGHDDLGGEMLFIPIIQIIQANLLIAGAAQGCSSNPSVFQEFVSCPVSIKGILEKILCKDAVLGKHEAPVDAPRAVLIQPILIGQEQILTFTLQNLGNAPKGIQLWLHQSSISIQH